MVLKYILLSVFSIQSLSVQSQSHTKTVATDNSQKGFTDKIVQEAIMPFMRDSARVGLSVGIYQGGKLAIYNYGSTQRGKKILPTGKTIYEIGSISKTFTATLLANALKENKIRLDDDIRLYLTDKYPNLENAGEPIKIVDLINHTSGLPPFLPNRPDIFNHSPDSIPLLLTAIQKDFTKHQFLNALHDVKIDTVPGFRYKYSNVDAQLTGFILENIYYKTYEELLTQYLTEPLKMVRTTAVIDPNTLGLAKGYSGFGNSMPYMPTILKAAGGIYSTVPDMLNYIGYYLDYKQEVVRLAQTLSIGDTIKQGIGLYWRINRTENGRLKYWHTGGTFGFSSYCVVYPDSNTGIVLLSNEMDMNSQGELMKVADKIIEGILPDNRNYVFFIHNKFTEEHAPDEKHTEYGRSQYKEILAGFKKEGFTIISEKRPANTDVKIYAKKVVTQIDSLLRIGIKPNKITVIGTSKGGYIAQYVSTYLANPQVNFVFIGSYQKSDLKNFSDINYCGNILTIYEKSDYAGVSAVDRKKNSVLKVTRFKEVELNTHLKHGFLFRALHEWIEPASMWAKQNYKAINDYNKNYKLRKKATVSVDTVVLYDKERDRKIPVAFYLKNKSEKKKLIIVSHGYGQNEGDSYLNYSYLTTYLASKGFFVVSIQHELPTDILMPSTGIPQIVRLPFWEHGAENIFFVINELKKTNPELNFSDITLIGHSNGGDITALFAQKHPNIVDRIITLDNRRMSLPKSFDLKVSSLRSSDQYADERVLPTDEEKIKYGITIIKLPNTIHNDMDDHANDAQRKEITTYILSFLKK